MQKRMRFDQLPRQRFVSGQLSVLMRVAYTLTALVCLVGWSGTLTARVQAAEPAKISPHLARQLKAVMEVKRSLTPTQQKMDTSLLMLMKQRRGEAVPFVPRGIEVADDGTVVVDIQCPVTDKMTEAIEAMGGEVLSRQPRYDTVRASVPVLQLETLASKSVVRAVRYPIPWVTRRGSTVTEGDVAHRADEARSTFGLDGSGGKACAISDGVDDLAARQAAGELPQNVEVLEGQQGTGSEGTALMEIVYDMAGGATLGFATALPNEQQYATNIRRLRDEMNCDVIYDDVGYLGQSPFQAGIISAAVADVVADGAVYLSAAGNDGSAAKGTSGTYEGDFFDSGVTFEELFPGLPIDGSLHDFDEGLNGAKIANQILTGGLATVLHWSDPLGESFNDYDLCMTDADLRQLVACSIFVQDGEGDPIEFIPFAEEGDQVLIINYLGTQEPRFLHLQTFEGILERGTSGSIFGHPGLDEAIAVGAADVRQTNGGPFTEDTEVENFSSDGPRRAFFEADGTPFTPGNLSSTGGVVRQKPDVTAADGVSTTTPRFTTFFGTSAGVPHAAAAAVLLKDADPEITAQEIEDVLEASAIDIEFPGDDDISGAGIIDAFSAVEDILDDDGDGTELINDALEILDLNTAFDPYDDRAPAGVFTIKSLFANVSTASISDIFFEVDTLTGGNMLLNADGGPGGEGSRISVLGHVNAGETLNMDFEIGLQQASPFRFFVDAFGRMNE